MADSPVEQLLLRFGFDLSPAKQGAGALKQILDELNKVLGAASAQQAQANKANIVAVQAAAKVAVEAAKQAVLEEQKKTASAKTATEELKKQAQEHRNATEQAKAAAAAEVAKKAAIQANIAAVQKQVQERKVETAEIQKQIAELRRKRMEEQAAGGHGEGADRFSIWGIGGGIGKALLGPGIGGAVAAGVLAGGGLTLILESAAHAVEHFVEKLKEITLESGKLSILQQQFEGLARGAGVDAARMMDTLREKTEGLVSQFQLLKIANTALKSGLGIPPEQIANLAGAVLKLAEARGMNAAQAMQMLDRALAMGRPQILSRVTGLASLRTVMDQIPPAASRAEKATLQWQKSIEMLVSKAEAIGELPETIERTQERMHIATKNLLESFGQGINESQGMQAFLKFLNDGAKSIQGLSGAAKNWGDTFGNVLGTLTPGLTAVQVLLTSIFDLLESSAKSLLQMFNIIDGQGRGAAGVVTGMVAAFTFLSTMIQEATFVIKSLIQNIESLVHNLLSVGSAAIAISTGQFAAAKQFLADATQDVKNIPKAWQDNWNEFDQKNREMLHRAQQAVDLLNKPKEKRGAIDFGKPDDTNIREQNRLAQLELQLTEAQDKRLRALAKSRLSDKEADLAYDKEVENRWYQEGEQNLETHIKRLKEIAEEEHNARLGQIAEDFKAQSQDLEAKQKRLDTQLKIGTIKPAEYKIQTKILEEDAKAAQDRLDSQLANERKRYQKEIYQIDEQGDRDRRAAHQKSIQAELQQEQEAEQLRLARLQRRLTIEQDAIRAEQQLRDKQFAAREITPDQYFQQTIAADKRLRDAQIQNAQDVYNSKKAIAEVSIKAAYDTYEAGIKNDAAAETRQQKVQKAATDLAKARETLQDNIVKYTQQTEEKITLLTESEIDKRLAYIQQSYSLRQQYLEGQFNQQQQSGNAAGQTANIRQILQSLTGEQIRLQDLSRRTVAGSDDWLKIQNDLTKVYDLQIKWNQELDKATNSVAILAGSLSGLAQTATGAGLFGSRFAQNLLSVAGVGFRSLEQSQTRANRITGYNPVTGETTGIKGDTFAETMKNFTDRMTAAAAAVADFVQTLTQSKSAIAGAVGGGISGMGLGQTLGTVGNQLGLFGSLGGPIGAVVGGVAGSVVGAITGAKNAAVTRNITHLQEQFKEIMNDFSLNTNNLNNAIQQMQLLVQQAREMQARSKKGSAQYQQVIDQYNQQLMQLGQQQHQLMVNLQEQLSVLRAPNGMQQYLDSLESIIKQYNQFEGAAQSANDLANANEFLVRSLQQYQLTLEDQIRQDNTQAINDAIQLNDLLYQRTQLTAQLNDQIRGVLTQGVTVRTATFAQQKGSQIEQLQYQGQLQLQQLNNEISATTYKVNAESKIFSLATTRVGLEAQLLQLQAAQTDRDMQRISALAALVQALQAGNYDFGPIANLINALPTVTNPAISGQYPTAPTAPANTPTAIQQLMQLFSMAGFPGMQGVSTMPPALTSALDNLVAGSYQDRATMGYGNFRGQNLL